nr:divergent polysaccharide deacetylase family protein [Thalassobius sp. Cn5-15]
MSIILLDRGDTALGVEALSAFPYPLSFAVDVTSPEALARMETYRAAGFEVLALSDIPVGATAADTETLLRAGLRELPEVVAVMEGDDTGLQSDKAVSDQVSAVLQESGHGAVFFAKGLNTAQKLARKNGVASASVFRDFDGNGQSAAVMRRFLDQAAFKARQQPEGVVMVGRLQPETISALLLWGLQDRASRVALAPVSALLR